MDINHLLRLQVLYFCLGMGYNLISYVKEMSGGQPLAATSPIVGAIFMGVYGLIVLAGYKRLYMVYRGVMAIMFILILYSGVIKHFIAYAQQPDAYASWLAWATAIAINIFGSILNLLAVSGCFKSTPKN